jgi:3-oxoacyl-[acyl-carrier protein] reductase
MAVLDPLPCYPELRGRVAVVTGGSKGIGAATARALASSGVHVAVVARSPKPLAALIDQIRRDGGSAVGIAADCTSPGDVDRLAREVISEFGVPDYVLPFAGGFQAFTPIQEITDDEWRGVIDANLTSTFLTVRAFVDGMIERQSGVIVTMASNAGRYMDKLLTASYAASKAGVVYFTRHIAMELGTHGIRANVIAPATVLTERVASIMDAESRAQVSLMSPLGRMGTPHDCALATLFLVSDSAAWLTGVTLDVAGGRVML